MTQLRYNLAKFRQWFKPNQVRRLGLFGAPGPPSACDMVARSILRNFVGPNWVARPDWQAKLIRVSNPTAKGAQYNDQ